MLEMMLLMATVFCSIPASHLFTVSVLMSDTEPGSLKGIAAGTLVHMSAKFPTAMTARHSVL